MYKIKVTGSGKMYDIEQKCDVIDVRFQICDGETVVAERRLNFSLETSTETIQEELQKYLVSFQNDQEIARTTQETERQNAVANDTIESLQGLEVS